jgi:hypothetical protein
MSISPTATRSAPAALRRLARKPALAAWLLALAGLAGGPLHAEPDQRYYQVEVVVFAQPAGASVELPPRQAAPRAPESTDAEPELLPDEFVAGEDDAAETLVPGFAPAAMPRELDRVAAAMNRGGYRLLWHQAWVQPALRGEAPSLDELAKLHGGAVAAGLQGGISLTAGRFLHLGVDLQLRSDERLEAELRQSRRVRLGVEQYFDHPAIGVIAVVNRLEPEADQSVAEP